MHNTEYSIHIAWDAEVNLWYIAESNVPGLVGEAPTWESMMALLRERVPEMLAENHCPADAGIPLQVLTTSHLGQLRQALA
jgi:hypothetical protein